MQLTIELIQRLTGATAQNAALSVAGLQAACDKYEINTPRRLAAFMANVAVESGNLSVLSENMNYSATRLAAVWPHRFADANGQPNAQAVAIQHNPKLIGDAVYGGRLGNGPDEGYEYRGGGYIQTTGKENYSKAADATGLDLVNHPELLQDRAAAAEVAAWQFMNVAGSYADAGDINGVIKAINGQPPCAANNGQARISQYNAAMKVLGVIDHQPSIEGESDNQSGADSEVKTGTVGDPSAATAPNTAPSAGAKSSKSKASASQ